MTVLMIGATERERIALIIANAKAHPVLFEQVRQGVMDDKPVLELKDRKPGLERPPSQHVIFPGGYSAAFSIEQQPIGFCTHLSIAVHNRTERSEAVPGLSVVAVICNEFGVPFPPDKQWLEEYAPGEYAVNLLSLYAPAQEGRA